MKMRDFSTPWKIGITIGIIIAGIIMLAAVSLIGSGSINKRVVNLYTQELKPLIALNSMKGAMYRYRDRTLRFILEAGDEDASRHIKHLKDQKIRIQTQIDKYKSTRLSDEERKYVAGFEEQWRKFAQIVEGQALPILMGGG